MKKTIFLVLMSIMLVAIFAVSVHAAEIIADGECPENIKWTVDSDGVLTISGTGMMRYSEESKYVVPWAEYADFVTKVIVEEGVTYIDRDAFMGFSKLEQVVLPEGLTGTGFVAFANCTALKEIVFPDSVEFIGSWSLSGCTALESVTLGNGILHAEFVFDASYPNLKVIYFNGTKEEWETPIRVTGSNCRPIQTLPEGVEVICLAEVKKCGKNTIWELDKNGVLTISGFGAISDFESGTAPWYADCAVVKQLVVQDGITEIGKYAFADCENLEYVSLPASLTRIGDYAFYGCAETFEMEYKGSDEEWWTVEKGINAFPAQPPVFACVARKTGSQVVIVATVSNMPEVERICAAMYDVSGKLIGAKKLTAQEAVIVDNADIKKVMFFAWNESFEPIEDKIEIEFE